MASKEGEGKCVHIPEERKYNKKDLDMSEFVKIGPLIKLESFSVCCSLEGWRGFYKGLLPGLIRVTPACCITFVVYENMIAYLMKKPLPPILTSSPKPKDNGDVVKDSTSEAIQGSTEAVKTEDEK